MLRNIMYTTKSTFSHHVATLVAYLVIDEFIARGAHMKDS